MTAHSCCAAAILNPELNPERVTVVNGLGKGFKFAADAMNVQSINGGHGFAPALDFGLEGNLHHAGHGGRHGEWTEEAIGILLEVVLKRAVHALDDKRTSQQTKEVHPGLDCRG